MTDAAYVVWFDDCDRSSTRDVGGKCASLGELIHAELDVPAGFAVTTTAHRLFLDRNDLRRRESELLESLDDENIGALQTASEALRSLVEEAALPPEVAASVREQYAELAARGGSDSAPVAVRSSALAEDMATASFAGQLQTFLWIEGEDAVVEHIRRCWSGFFTPEALAYRKRLEIPEDDALMSVGVQRMVDARSAGVMFTLNPVNGDRSKIMIESTWGLGESVVSGAVNPDRFLVDKVTLDILERTIGSKETEQRFDAAAGALVEAAVDDERRAASSLADVEIHEIARLGKQIERHYGSPQDVEWAIDPEGGLFLLQARSETVWSRRERPPLVEKSGSALDYVLADLLSRAPGSPTDVPTGDGA
jgi:pyruvate, water dikinase